MTVHTANEPLRGGTLMIGSLYWEDEHNAPGAELGRLKRLWRQELDLRQKVFMEAPIRYGMRSARRWHTYTMVFSQSAPMGRAIWAPFRKKVDSVDGFLAQARQLGVAEGYAEGDNPDPLYCSWGLVSICWHPGLRNSNHPFVHAWREAFTDFGLADTYGIAGEPSCVNEVGELTIDLAMPDDLDYLLATPNVPNLEQYPSSRELADAIQRSSVGYDTYLRKNVAHGIRVPGDEAALALLGV